MMPPVVSALLAFVAALFRSHTSLRLENLALRHRLAVYQQTVYRPRLCPTDRLFWARLSRLWSAWQDALAFVQPRTVIAWQRQRFRDHWRRLSQYGTPGRPMIAKEVRTLIRTMWQSNPTWGAPRVERLSSSIRRECLDHIIVLSERHLRRVLASYLAYYHGWRTHLALAMDSPNPRPMQPPAFGPVNAVPEVGDLHHHDERWVA